MRLSSHSAKVGQEEGDKAREVQRGSLGHLVTQDKEGGGTHPVLQLSPLSAVWEGAAGWMAEMAVTCSFSMPYLELEILPLNSVLLFFEILYGAPMPITVLNDIFKSMLL